MAQRRKRAIYGQETSLRVDIDFGSISIKKFYKIVSRILTSRTHLVFPAIHLEDGHSSITVYLIPWWVPCLAFHLHLTLVNETLQKL
jgi:hypothetical protein